MVVELLKYTGEYLVVFGIPGLFVLILHWTRGDDPHG